MSSSQNKVTVALFTTYMVLSIINVTVSLWNKKGERKKCTCSEKK